MPLHDFHCPLCLTTLERLVKPNTPNPACPTCKGPTTKLQIGLTAPPVFCGTGYYQTDFKGKS